MGRNSSQGKGPEGKNKRGGMDEKQKTAYQLAFQSQGA